MKAKYFKNRRSNEIDGTMRHGSVINYSKFAIAAQGHLD